MIRLLKRKDINDIHWNQCVANSPDGQAFFYTWYLDACCEEWSGLVNDNYTAIFPIAHRSRFGISYLYQPYFTRHFGLIANAPQTVEIQKAFLSAIPDDYKYWDFCLHQGHKSGTSETETTPKLYQELPLHARYPELQQRYSANHQRNIRKARKNNLSLKTDFRPDEVVENFRKYQLKQREEFNDEAYGNLLDLMQAAKANADILSQAAVDQNNQLLAGAFFIKTNARLLYLKGFSTPEGKRTGAMHFLFDTIIQSHAEESLTLDFGGSSVKSVARFYQGFGSQDCVYLRLKVNRLPRALRWIKR